MASLNGAVIGPPASLITLRVACGVGCENAPHGKNSPHRQDHRQKTNATIHDFPPFEWPANTPRECNTQFAPRQAPPAQVEFDLLPSHGSCSSDSNCIAP